MIRDPVAKRQNRRRGRVTVFHAVKGSKAGLRLTPSTVAGGDAIIIR